MKSHHHLFPFNSYFYFRFPFPVSWPTLSYRCRPMSNNVGSVIFGSGHGRKCGGSHWNRFAICFRSKVISTSGFQPAVLNSDSRHRRRPCSMLGLSKAMIPRHDQMLIHKVPAKRYMQNHRSVRTFHASTCCFNSISGHVV